jgi:non-canonical poly(A) RNA polymerase PAPD5/7
MILAHVQVVAKAKVPIVKLVVMPFGLKFDISIGKSNGLEAVTLIREHLQKWPPLRPLVTILKLYLLQRNMNEVFTGGLSSYALIISVVAFLELHQSRVVPIASALLSCCANMI